MSHSEQALRQEEGKSAPLVHISEHREIKSRNQITVSARVPAEALHSISPKVQPGAREFPDWMA